MLNWKVLTAEFIGTFALVFAGAAVGIYTDDLLNVALAHGLTLAVLVFIYGNVSGAYFNPAITLGMAVKGALKWGDAAMYWVAQFAGSIVAAVFLRLVIAEVNIDLFEGASASGILVTRSAPPFILAILVEAVLTFFFMTSILQVSADSKAGSYGWLVIGFTLTFAILAGGPLTGATLNPARSFGTALFTKALLFSKLDYLNITLYQVYFLGPILGALAAVGLHGLMKSDASSGHSREDDSGYDSGSQAVSKPAIRKNRK